MSKLYRNSNAIRGASSATNWKPVPVATLIEKERKQRTETAAALFLLLAFLFIRL